MMEKQAIHGLDDFYVYVKEQGKLRTIDHAKRWTAGTLQMLGVNVSRDIKSRLSEKLPDELNEQLGQVFWLAHFRNTNMSLYDFNNRVARRSRANSDPDFAKYPVSAVMGGIKAFLDDGLVKDVRDDLAPELSSVWETA